MHIPDGFLDARTIALTAGLSAAGLAAALRQTRSHLPRRHVPLMGLTAAVIFAAQMLNFPVALGTSGHLMGAVLAAVLVGPAAAVVVMTAVLVVQCLVFSDGGITALGANVFNMAIIGSIGGWGIYRVLCHVFRTRRGMLLAASFAAWCSTVLAALCCAGELAASGTAKASLVFPAMANIHMLIGLGEATITAMVLAAVMRTRPELLALGEPSRRFPVAALPAEPAAPAIRWWPIIAYGLLIALGLAIFVAPFASEWDDGLESVARTFGFADRATQILHGIAPDYLMPGISRAALAVAAAGALGTLLAFGLSMLLAHLLVPRAATARATP